MARSDSRFLATPGDNTMALALLTLAVALPLLVFGEKISFNQGYGFDGHIFGPMAADFYGALKDISQYRLQRSLPSALLHHVYLALGVPFTAANIVSGYVLLNVAALAGGSFVWGRIADHLAMSQTAKWLGGVALIANFAALKMLSYNPVLMDGTAFLLGLLVFDSWLRGRTLRLHVLAVITVFAWQTAWIYCVPLLIFPRQQRAGGGEGHSILAAAAGVLSALLFVGVLLLNPAIRAAPAMLAQPYTAFKILIACAWLGLGVRELVQAFPLRDAVPDVRRALISFGAAVVTVTLIVLILKLAPSAPNEYPMSFAEQLPDLFSRAVERPGVFALAMLIYFGPITYLALWRWRALSRFAATLGPGMPIFLGMSLAMSLNSESRHLIFVFPVVVALTIKALDARPIAPASVVLFLVLSLAVSRVWLPIGNPPGTLYYMNFGPWWGLQIYVTSLLIAIVTGVLVTWMFRARPPRRQ